MKQILKTIFFRKLITLFLILSPFLFSQCNKVDQPNYITYQSYYPLKPGKVFTYQLDSIVTTAFGVAFVTHSYIIKDSVMDTIYDNQNRLSFRIFRYVETGNNKWESNNNTFLVTPTANKVEYVENNLRYIKMTNPIARNISWNGNSYLDITPYSFDPNFVDWKYGYSDIGAAKTFNGILYPNTITVIQYDSTQNQPFDPRYLYQAYQNGYEVYADSVGMVYKYIIDWEYQATTNISGCRRVTRNNAGVADTTLIDCQNNPGLCDSISNLPGNKIIDCDTSVSSYFYNGYGIRQVLLQHN